MEFYWAGFIFWSLIIIAISLLGYGLWRKSWKALIVSGIVFFPPMLYFSGAENWFRLLALIPLVPFVLAYYLKKYW